MDDINRNLSRLQLYPDYDTTPMSLEDINEMTTTKALMHAEAVLKELIRLCSKNITQCETLLENWESAKQTTEDGKDLFDKIDKWSKDNQNILTMRNDVDDMKANKADKSTIIDVAKLSDLANITSNKTYILDKKTYTPTETIRIQNANNIIIDGNGCKIDSDESVAFNIFEFENCSNVTFKNFNFEPRNAKATTLYHGALIYTTNCNNFKIFNNTGLNCTYLICCKHDNYNFDIYSNIVKIDNPGNWNNPVAFSGIISYANHDIKIYNNSLYGNMKDGNLSIFGAPSYNIFVNNNLIDDSYCKVWDSQGITIDQGISDTIVSSNIVKSCYYGIDLKAGCFNIKCDNNVLIGNKISIADRRGESTNANASFNINITNNLIIFKNTNILASGHTKIAKYNIIGILSEKRYGCRIQNNNIRIQEHSDFIYCGIFANQRLITNNTSYKDVFIINENNISFEYAFESDVFKTGADSNPININLLDLVNINSNTIICPTSINTQIIISNGCTNITISNNFIKCYTKASVFLNTSDGTNTNQPTNVKLIGNSTNNFTDNANTAPQLFNSLFVKDTIKNINNLGFSF